MCNDLGEGSRCCAFYSAVGFIFTTAGMEREQRPDWTIQPDALTVNEENDAGNLQSPEVVGYTFFDSCSMSLWVGIMIHTQSFFIAGIDDADKARASAWGATGMFLATFVASVGGIWYDSQKKEPSIESYGEPESEYQLQPEYVPNYGTSA
ncbi:predicted protein [Phaeodactylum tricornutum CCAP 1055/1]|uniref:Uncharacterized protein n=3 Tax=Phaeodactylum tricornutum TaxID=2850 RepID=B7FRJ7_PHATC|nr:predicted protein [Phaeodactylum tricornutum CCAP 1055/1]EEC51020.1 predicted protein [Phaeodactylum tricornutum CCAP 1055/1]|eukprot:XP_002176557.1 predicted protein [Phaeodactylum tricornutum CCAP 1055/1]